MSMYPDVYGFAEFGAAESSDPLFLTFMVVYLIIMLLSSIYSIVVYVLHALGMYTIANRRSIHHPWMAWVPVVNMWILGSISDQYQYVVKGKVRNRRKILLGLMIALYALLIVICVAVFIVAFSVVGAEVSGGEIAYIGPVVLLVIGYLAMMVIAITTTVFQYIAYYDLFVSCNPNNAVAFLVLGIFFSFLLPYFVFACRKKDLGMPPRKAPVQSAPCQSVDDSQQPPVQQIPALQPAVEQETAEEPETVTEADFEPEE